MEIKIKTDRLPLGDDYYLYSTKFEDLVNFANYCLLLEYKFDWNFPGNFPSDPELFRAADKNGEKGKGYEIYLYPHELPMVKEFIKVMK